MAVTEKELSERKGILTNADIDKIYGNNKPPTDKEIKEKKGNVQKGLEKNEIKSNATLKDKERTNVIYGEKIHGKESLTQEYLKSSDSVKTPLNKWMADQNRNFRIEQRAREKKQTKATMFQATVRHSEEVDEKKPKRYDIDIIDKDWILSKFVTPDKDLEDVDRINRYFTSTGWKFTSTRLGYATAINARPQFTRYADIKGNGKEIQVGEKTLSFFTKVNKYPVPNSSRSEHGIGMGRYYSEAIDDNATTVFMEFGIPKFNNLITWIGRAVNPVDSFIANYGYVPLGYYIGRAVGGVIVVRAFPITSMIIFIGKWIFGSYLGGNFNYYYMKPAMHTYWSTVSTIVTQMSTELGLFPPMVNELMNNKDKQTPNRMGVPVHINNEDIQALHSYYPDLVSENTGYIDIYAVALKAQTIANKWNRVEYDIYKETNNQIKNKDTEHEKISITPKQLEGYVTRSEYITKAVEKHEGFIADINANLSLAQFLTNITGKAKSLKKWVEDKWKDVTLSVTEKISFYASNADGTPANKDLKDDAGVDMNTGTKLTKDDLKSDDGKSGTKDNSVLYNTDDGSYKTNQRGYMEKYADAFDSIMRDGGQYAIFNVDFQGGVSDSVSNSVSDIELGGMAKSVSTAARNVKFNTAGGNILPGMDDVREQVVGVITGALESATFGMSNVIMTLLGGGYIDVPKKWDDSSISLPSVNYSMTLIAPYGHPISQLQNIYIPLAMLLAGSLPMAVGNASYSSPLLCSIFNKGVQNIRMGMITSLSISRGTSNLPYSRSKRCLAYEVSFSVTDFSNIMAAPVNSSMFGELFFPTHNDDSLFGNYIATLASRDLYTEKYAIPKARLKAARLAQSVSQATSAANHAMKMNSGIVKTIISPFVAGRSVANQNQSNNYF